jgi:uncharacterized membrane protein
MNQILHRPSFRANSILLVGFLVLGVWLGITLPERYPVHFDLAGNPTRWEEGGVGMWILIVTMGILTMGKMHLFQRFVLADPDSTLVNVPHKEAFLRLPQERRIPVFRRMNRMLGLLNTASIALFSVLLLLTWWSAHAPGGWEAGLARWSLWVALVFLLVFPLTESVALSRMIRRKLREEGLLPGG